MKVVFASKSNDFLIFLAEQAGFRDLAQNTTKRPVFYEENGFFDSLLGIDPWIKNGHLLAKLFHLSEKQARNALHIV